MNQDPRVLLRTMLDAAIAAALPDKTLPAYLPSAPRGRMLVIGCGKAAGSMAKAVEDHWPGELSGMVVTRYGYKVPTSRIEVIEAAHPVPDEAGRRAAERMLAMVRGLSPDDLVLFLVSGGGSSLLSLPAPGLTLGDKQAINKALLKSGATISEMNCVRKHLSAVKGGRLAAACAPARVITLAISDIPGDDPAVIASGPTVADATTFADARAILDKYHIIEPGKVIEHLLAAKEETPKPGDPRLAKTELHMIAAPQMSLEAAAEAARRAGVTPVILGDAIEGEAREVAIVHAGIARQVKRHGQPANRPCVLLSGGETTVTVRGKGRGGRNAEFLLALAVALGAEPDVYALAGDTDGIDGTEDNAGALLTPDTLMRAAAHRLDAKRMLADNDGYSFFSGLGDLVMTGPTLTNVNDFRAILII
ncbi:MAG TPA: glycerate kinase [Burkholderiales bacterium]|nr:glycerate kinase [Burkholderiales bacterium]